jgi:hypothetical protein
MTFHRARHSLTVTFAALLLAVTSIACTDGDSNARLLVYGSGPSSIFSASIFPQAVALVPFHSTRCSGAPAFATTFDLVIDFSGANQFAMNEVTLQLIDGSHLGGTPVTFPAPAIATAGRSVFLSSGRRGLFTFHPKFECAVRSPRSLVADIVLLDAAGFRHNRRLTVPAI